MKKPTRAARMISIGTDQGFIDGILEVPPHPQGVVILPEAEKTQFGSGRRRAARQFRKSKMATLLLNLLTNEEEAIDLQTSHLRFDLSLLTQRLLEAIDWLHCHPKTRNLKVGFYPVRTAVGAALAAAAEQPEFIHAIVASGGRPDLAGKALKQVKTPTLLLVNPRDKEVVAANRKARALLSNEKNVRTVIRPKYPMSESHQEQERLMQMAVNWFEQYLGCPASRPRPAFKASILKRP